LLIYKAIAMNRAYPAIQLAILALKLLKLTFEN
jgi:hypothetical protein